MKPVSRRATGPGGIVEHDSMTRLPKSGRSVICGGRGGAPVAEGRLQGVEAVVDKDSMSAMLAIDIQVDRLLVVTDAPAVKMRFGTRQAAPPGRLDLVALADLRLPAGSMVPKIAACRRFGTVTGQARWAVLGKELSVVNPQTLIGFPSATCRIEVAPSLLRSAGGFLSGMVGCFAAHDALAARCVGVGGRRPGVLGTNGPDPKHGVAGW